MSIREAIAWLFDVGDGTAAETQGDAGPAGIRRADTGLHETLESHLYGQAEAIRVLYQPATQIDGPPKPPRAKRHRAPWAARYVDALSASLSDPVGIGSLERQQAVRDWPRAGTQPRRPARGRSLFFVRQPD